MDARLRTGRDGKDGDVVAEVHQAGNLVENEGLAQGRELVDENRDAQPPAHGVPCANAQVT